MHERLVYVSSAVSAPDETVLRELLTVSRDRNIAADVTGMLVYAERSFMQMIEGPPEAITDTYGRITEDSRHRDVRLLLRTLVDARMFPSWAMGFYWPDSDALIRDLPGYRAEGAYPFVAGDLVPNGDVATTLMRMWATDVG
jgi:hypothetical protein